MKEITVEGKKLTVYHRNFDAEYCVFDNKIWSMWSRQGQGIHAVIGLRRDNTGEEIYIFQPQFKDLLYIMKPTGYISI